MQFDINKFQVLNVGRRNPQYRYTINHEALLGSNYGKYLGVRISSDRSLRTQYTVGINKANRVLGYSFKS